MADIVFLKLLRRLYFAYLFVPVAHHSLVLLVLVLLVLVLVLVLVLLVLVLLVLVLVLVLCLLGGPRGYSATRVMLIALHAASSSTTCSDCRRSRDR